MRRYHFCGCYIILLSLSFKRKIIQVGLIKSDQIPSAFKSKKTSLDGDRKESRRSQKILKV